MTVTPAQLDSSAAILTGLAGKIRDVRRHVAQERAGVTGYPIRGESVGGRSTGGLTSVEAAAEQLLRLTRHLDDIEAGLTLLVITAFDVRGACDEILGIRLAARQAATEQRCNQRIDATCANIASDHRHPDTGATVVGLCDECWTSACPTCRERPPESRRGGECQACYRRGLRAIKADTRGVA
jgi:hypothetical protein